MLIKGNKPVPERIQEDKREASHKAKARAEAKASRERGADEPLASSGPDDWEQHSKSADEMVQRITTVLAQHDLRKL